MVGNKFPFFVNQKHKPKLNKKNLFLVSTGHGGINFILWNWFNKLTIQHFTTKNFSKTFEGKIVVILKRKKIEYNSHRYYYVTWAYLCSSSISKFYLWWEKKKCPKNCSITSHEKVKNWNRGKKIEGHRIFKLHNNIIIIITFASNITIQTTFIAMKKWRYIIKIVGHYLMLHFEIKRILLLTKIPFSPIKSYWTLIACY